MTDQPPRKSVLMLLPNGFHPDPRVHREAKSLVENGFNVTIIAWDREARWPKSENCDGISVLRVAIKSTYGRGTQQLLYLLRFWLQASLIASKMHFDILHCHDFITLPVGVMIAKIKHRKVIFDAHESYGEMLNGTVPGPLRWCIGFLERILLRHIDLLVTVGSILERDYQLRGARRTRVIGNWKSLNDFKIGRKQLVAEKKRLGIGKEQIVISFLGYLHGDRKILPLIEAVKKSGDTFLILGGMGSQEDKIRNAVNGCENIKFIGRYGPEKIA
ncbi:MAG: glycosyltransferase, partial [bacterium]